MVRAFQVVSFSFLPCSSLFFQILPLKKHDGFQNAVKIMESHLDSVKDSFRAFVAQFPKLPSGAKQEIRDLHQQLESLVNNISGTKLPSSVGAPVVVVRLQSFKYLLTKPTRISCVDCRRHRRRNILFDCDQKEKYGAAPYSEGRRPAVVSCTRFVQAGGAG